MSREYIKELIIKSHSKYERNRKEYSIYNTNVFIINQLPENINLGQAIHQIENIIPSFLMNMIDAME